MNTDEQASAIAIAESSVKNDQSNFECYSELGWAYFHAERLNKANEPWWRPYGLYAAIDNQEIMGGFAMYGRWPATDIPAHHDDAKPGIDFILRFMIDQRYQGQGYGRAGMQALLDQIKREPNLQAIEISYDIANSVMAHLCTQAGFQPTGRINNGEIEARLLMQDAFEAR